MQRLVNLLPAAGEQGAFGPLRITAAARASSDSPAILIARSMVEFANRCVDSALRAVPDRTFRRKLRRLVLIG
jgi:hypothetical protein